MVGQAESITYLTGKHGTLMLRASPNAFCGSVFPASSKYEKVSLYPFEDHGHTLAAADT